MVVGELWFLPGVWRGADLPCFAPPGESGLGKTTLINTLFSTELSQAKNYRSRFAKQLDKTTEVDIIKAEVRRWHPRSTPESQIAH